MNDTERIDILERQFGLTHGLLTLVFTNLANQTKPVLHPRDLRRYAKAMREIKKGNSPPLPPPQT